MFIKRRTRSKDGKTHVYYSVCESLRLSRSRVVQRQVLHLGELNTTQLDCWQKTIDVLHEDGQRYQRRLFSAREGAAPNEPDVVRWPRRIGSIDVGTGSWNTKRLWNNIWPRAGKISSARALICCSMI